MYSLFIDTHFSDVILILYKNGIIVDKIVLCSCLKHSLVTMPSIKDLLDRNNLQPNKLGEIIVVNGPGSFTGVRIGVTIAKAMAYSLNIPIKVIDSLLLKAVSVDSDVDEFYVSIEDKNGAYIGLFNKNKLLTGENYSYIAKNDYLKMKESNVIYNEIDIDYEKVYDCLSKIDSVNVHSVKPLYVKNIEALK